MRFFRTDEGDTVTLAQYCDQANNPDCGMTREDLADINALEVGDTIAVGFTFITRIANEQHEPHMDTLQEMAGEDADARSLGLL